MNPAESTERKRGGCLTAWLAFVMLANLFVVLHHLYYLSAGWRALPGLPGLPAWVVPVETLLAVVACVCIIGIWKWKRWGFYGFIGLYLIGFAVNLFAVNLKITGFALAVPGLVGLVILVVLVRPVWRHLE